MGRMTSALKPVADRYNLKNAEERYQFRRHVLGIRRTAAVARPEGFSSLPIGFYQQIGNIGKHLLRLFILQESLRNTGRGRHLRFHLFLCAFHSLQR